MTDFDRAFRSGQEVTGGHKEAQPDVVAAIRRLTKHKIDAFWIGKTSGGEQGCRERWSKKYKSDGMNKMAIVYESSSEDYALKMEDYLIDRFEGHQQLQNQV